jgi:aspartate-semialdehyde dehydrogenase
MKLPVAILGANGTVGQKAISLLTHPQLPYIDQFEIVQLAASSDRVGKKYCDEVQWRENTPLPQHVAEKKFINLKDVDAPYVISALPADVALEIEPLLSQKGCLVFSNASAFRTSKNVPLLIPEINPTHLELINSQTTSGKIITNPNCATVSITFALKPLLDLAPIKHVSITTLQAISGAGYPGVSALDIYGNTIPNINSEEEKIRFETKRILGDLSSPHPMTVSVQVNRVGVLNGHTASIHVEFFDDISVMKAQEKIYQFQEKFPNMVEFYPDTAGTNFFPQPLKHLHDHDFRAHIGRLQNGGSSKHLSVICLTHNVVRGAAGAAIVNMLEYIKVYKK